MNSTKKWYQSSGLWGGATALLASAFMLANMIFSGAVDPEVIETLQSEQLVEAIEVIVAACVSTAGAIVAIIGRLKAKDKIE
jgi:hypothetical protein